MFCGDLPVLWSQGVWEDEVLCRHIPDIYFGDRGAFVRMWVSVQPAFDAAYEYTAKYIFRFGALPEYLYRWAYFLFLYNICTGVFTALGDSRTPLYLLIASSLGNIVLDLVFVIVFHMGVAGVAWATFIAQGISSLLAFATLLRRLKDIEVEEPYSKFSWEMAGKISRVAVPSILQQSFISVGNLFVQGLINSYGSAVVAGYSAGMKVNTFAITCFSTLGNGLSSFTAQNTGAGKPERISQGFRAGVRLVLCVAVPAFLLFFMFSPLSFSSL